MRVPDEIHIDGGHILMACASILLMGVALAMAGF